MYLFPPVRRRLSHDCLCEPWHLWHGGVLWNKTSVQRPAAPVPAKDISRKMYTAFLGKYLNNFLNIFCTDQKVFIYVYKQLYGDIHEVWKDRRRWTHWRSGMEAAILSTIAVRVCLFLIFFLFFICGIHLSLIERVIMSTEMLINYTRLIFSSYIADGGFSVVLSSSRVL